MQEVAYHCLQELWLENVFPGVIYANANIPKKHFRVLQSCRSQKVTYLMILAISLKKCA